MKNWKFPAGEIGVQVENADTNNIVCKFKSSDDILKILFEADAMKRYRINPQITLSIPYFPYARQDRVMQLGESHSLRVIADLINSVGFAQVTTADPHSDVVEALVNNLKIIPQYVCAINTIGGGKLADYDYLIAPDAGALKKIYKLAQLYQKPVICAQKTRSVTDGKITGTFISKEDYNSLIGKKALVVDDIGDGMGTFVGLAECIKKNQPEISQLDVYVTHGIFSKGLDLLAGLFDNVYTYNLMNDEVRNHDLLVKNRV